MSGAWEAFWVLVGVHIGLGICWCAAYAPELIERRACEQVERAALLKIATERQTRAPEWW